MVVQAFSLTSISRKFEMAIRRKEKQLTLPEIKEKARDHTKEFWMHGEPLLGFTPHLEGGALVPLAPKAESDLLAFFFLDPADYITDRVLETITLWHELYKKLPWTPIVVFRSNYLFLKNPRFFDRFRTMPSFQNLSVFLDDQGEWFQLKQVPGPTLLLSVGNETILSAELNDDYVSKLFLAEQKLQSTLRRVDAGLPLVEVTKHESKSPIDLSRALASETNLTGFWSNAESGLASDDPTAKISFPISGTHVRLIAVTHPQARENTKLQIFLDDLPVPASLHGAQVHPGDRNQSVLEINKFSGIYELIKSDRKLNGTITLKFLNTLENPVVLYGLRIA
jgi:hypothetical protein